MGQFSRGLKALTRRVVAPAASPGLTVRFSTLACVPSGGIRDTTSPPGRPRKGHGTAPVAVANPVDDRQFDGLLSLGHSQCSKETRSMIAE